MAEDKRMLMCNNTAEFLIFTGQVGGQSIEARYEVEAVLFVVTGGRLK